jgi:glycosyltransferase involved in cell wall biosynthesis
MPKVSFVVPCYKLAHLLQECVTSILEQTCEDFEILVMDDCSPDSTPDVAKSFTDSRISYVRNEANLGNIRNYNKGIKMARGKYIWLISADDRLKQYQVLERYVTLLDEHPEIGYVFCPAITLSENGEEELLEASRYADTDLIIPAADHAFFDALLLNTEFHLIAPTVMIRKECYDRISYFPEDLPHRGDTYVWGMFAMQYAVGYLAEPMVNYRIHNSSMMSLLRKQTPDVIIQDDITVLWQIKRVAEKFNHVLLTRCCNNAIADLYARNIMAHIMAPKDFETSVSCFSLDKKERCGIRASTYRRAGDYARWRNDASSAIEMYKMALRSQVWGFSVWVRLSLAAYAQVWSEIGRYLKRIMAIY